MYPVYPRPCHLPTHSILVPSSPSLPSRPTSIQHHHLVPSPSRPASRPSSAAFSPKTPSNAVVFSFHSSPQRSCLCPSEPYALPPYLLPSSSTQTSTSLAPPSLHLSSSAASRPHPLIAASLHRLHDGNASRDASRGRVMRNVTDQCLPPFSSPVPSPLAFHRHAPSLYSTRRGEQVKI